MSTSCVVEAVNGEHPSRVRVAGPDDRGVCTITLNRPDKANALAPEFVEDLWHAIERAEEFGAAVIVLDAAGRNFCAGFDLSDVDLQSDGDLLLRFARIAMLLERLSGARAVTVARVRGSAFGAGGDLALACDYRVGAGSPRFRFPGLGFGVPLGVSRLTHVVGPATAADLAGGAVTVTGADAVRLGLLTHLVDESDVESAVAALVDKWCTMPPAARASFVRLSRRAPSNDDLAELTRACADVDLGRRLRLYAKASRAR